MTSDMLDDMPSSVSIGAMIAGLTDLAIALNKYTIGHWQDGQILAFCHTCVRDVITYADDPTALELLNDILGHNEAEHKDVEVSDIDLVPTLIRTASGDDETGESNNGG